MKLNVMQEREARKAEKDVKICRVEQISPFPFDLVQRELKRYPNAEIVWCQEVLFFFLLNNFTLLILNICVVTLNCK